MKQALERSIPRELFALYDVAMDRIKTLSQDSREIAMLALAWIFHSKRPFTMNELRSAIAVEDGDRNLEFEDLTPGDEILELCGSFIVHDKLSNTVTLCHEIVREYLKTRCLESLKLTQTMMAKTCLTYLCFDVFEQSFENKDSINYLETMSLKYPFSIYAARYWGKYVKCTCETEPEIVMKLLELLQSRSKADCMARFISPERPAIGWSLLHIIADNDLIDMANMVFTNKRKLSISKDQLNVNARTVDGRTPLHFAAPKGFTAMARLLIRRGANVDAENYAGYRPLHLAARCGNTQILELLLFANANVDAATKFGHTAMHIASFFGQSDTVRLLLNAKADIDARDERGSTPLHLAAEACQVHVMGILLEYNANFNITDNEGLTPLHDAAISGHVEALKILFFYGADMCAETNDGSTALHLVFGNTQEGIIEIVQTLVKANPSLINKPNKSGFTPLLKAVDENRMDIVTAMLTITTNIVRSIEAGPALLRAAANGQTDMLDTLIRSNTDVCDEVGRTTLHLACREGYLELVKRLLASKMNVLAKDKCGLTPLHFACLHEFPDPEVLRVLLNAGACVSDQDEKGRTPLFLAATSDSSENNIGTEWGTFRINQTVKIVTLFLDHDITVINLGTFDGETPLHVAVKSCNHEVVKTLLNAGADPNPVTREGITPMHIAADNGIIEAVKSLLSAGAYANSMTRSGESPLHFALRSGHSKIAALLSGIQDSKNLLFFT